MKKTNETTPNVNIGEILREARTKLKITRKDLAGQLGITPGKLGRYENGVYVIPKKILMRLLRNGMGNNQTTPSAADGGIHPF